MNQPIESNHFTDGDANPAGGSTYGPGFAIAWQNGPLATGVAPHECIVDHEDPDSPYEGHGKSCRRAPNGAFVETIITAAIDRLEFYQASKFECDENAGAIRCLEAALGYLNDRTAKREERQVEGTHEV